jgi:hypothetical protein
LRSATTIATNGEIIGGSIGRNGSGGGGSIDESGSTDGSAIMIGSGTGAGSGSATTTGSGGIGIIDAQPEITSSASNAEDRASVNRTDLQIVIAQNSAATLLERLASVQMSPARR